MMSFKKTCTEDSQNDNFNLSKQNSFGYQSTQPNLHHSKRSWKRIRILTPNSKRYQNLQTQRRRIYRRNDRTYRNAYRMAYKKSVFSRFVVHT